jgi:hypothetical protein
MVGMDDVQLPFISPSGHSACLYDPIDSKFESTLNQIESTVDELVGTNNVLLVFS